MATLAVIVAFSVKLASSTNDNAAKVRDARDMRSLVSEILTKVLNAETGQRGFLLTGEPRYLQPYDKAQALLPLLLRHLHAMSDSHPMRAQYMGRIDTLVTAKLAELKQTVDLAKANKTGAALATVRSDRDKKLMPSRSTTSGSNSGAIFDGAWP